MRRQAGSEDVNAAGRAWSAADLAAVHRTIESYYSTRFRQFGATPLGVDWSCVATQEMRFVQLLKLCEIGADCSLNDLGCGYGALLALLARRHPASAIDYVGIELSAAMVRSARRRWRGHPGCRFVQGEACPRQADYSLASGIFNVQLDQPCDLWEAFIRTTLDGLAASSRRGFSVNFIAAPAGRAIEAGLYATTPGPWLGYCASRFDAAVELVTGYGLREFTLLVRLPRVA